MNIFLLGATGYIGSVVAEKLQHAGHHVVGLARSEAAAQSLRSRSIVPVRGSLEDIATLAAAAQDADAVIHAAFPQGGHDFVTAVQVEREAVRTLLRALEGTNKHILITSGTAVLGDTENHIFDEETPIVLPEPNPEDEVQNTPLEALKERLKLEQAVRQHSGVRGIVLRPPIVYGRSDGQSILALLRQAGRLLGAVPYAIGTGAHRWSFVHVEDLASLYLLALERASQGELFHAGAQSGLQTKDIAEAISWGIGLGGQTIELTIPQLGEALGVAALAPYWATNSQSSSEKARSVLGWQPQHLTLLEDLAQRSATIS